MFAARHGTSSHLHRPAPRISPGVFWLLLTTVGGCSRAKEAYQQTDSRSTATFDVPEAQVAEVTALEPGERRPVLFFLHGLGSSGRVAFESLHLAQLAARERVFVIAPDGSLDSQGRRFWNAGPACCNFDQRPVDDVARLGALIANWRARPTVDSARVYVAGHSNGGFMAQRLACAFPDRISAVASISGASPAADVPCRPSRLAWLEVHGDADDIVRYEGGTVFDSSGLAPHPSAAQSLALWCQRLGCMGPIERSVSLDLNSELKGAETSVEQATQCPEGRAVLWTMHGGGHNSGLGSAALAAVWSFLATNR